MGCHWRDNVWTSFTLPRPKSQKVYSSVKLLHIIEQMMAILMSRDLKVHIVDLAVTVPSGCHSSFHYPYKEEWDMNAPPMYNPMEPVML